jgi:methionyl-tRNA formyltransferase
MRSGSPSRTLPDHPRIIFMGTPDFALPPLDALIRHGEDIVLVVTQPDRPKGRGKKVTASPVKLLALENAIEVVQPEKVSDAHFCNLIANREPDLIVVVAFGQILKKRLLDIPTWGVVNIHASLLPKYRGAAPIQTAILNKEDKTGLTVMHMDEGLDTGPILLQEEHPILEDETAGHLHDRLSLAAGDLVIKWLQHMSEHLIEEKPQDHAAATYAPKIEKENTLINWRQPASRVSALIRALDPKPGAYTIWKDKKIKLFSSGVANSRRLDGTPGKVAAGQRDEGLIVETGQGAIKILEIQYPGKKRLPAKEYLRGFPLPEGTILGR